MTTLTAQQIACVYAWLAQLFSRELDDEQLTQIASAQMAEWFSLLKSEPPLTAAVNELENRIATLTVRDDARLELTADFLRPVSDDRQTSGAAVCIGLQTGRARD